MALQPFSKRPNDTGIFYAWMGGCLKAVGAEPSPWAGRMVSAAGSFFLGKGEPLGTAPTLRRGSGGLHPMAHPCSSHWGCSQQGQSFHLSPTPWPFLGLPLNKIYWYSPSCLGIFKIICWSCINLSFFFFFFSFVASPPSNGKLLVTFTRLTGHATSQMNLLYSWQMIQPQFSGSFTLFWLTGWLY